MTESHEQNRRDRLARAYQSLEGLRCGDAFGERFFVREELALSLIRQKAVPRPPWGFTDDTMMAISVVSTLEEHAEIVQDHLAKSFAKNYDPSRGYGPAMHGLLARIRHGGYWRHEAKALFDGQGSFGNGSAMRVAPLGAYFADDLDKVVDQAERSAVTTHCHREAVAGAIAVAVAAALAWRQGNSSSQLSSSGEFLQQIHQRTPPSEVRKGIQNAIDFPNGTAVQTVASALGNGSMVTAQDTVPFALWSAACHLDDYKEALWATVSGLGDRDTTCAMVGGVVVMSTGTRGIPKEWLHCQESIPRHMLKNCEALYFPDNS